MTFFTELGWLVFPMLAIEFSFTFLMCYIAHRHAQKLKSR